MSTECHNAAVKACGAAKRWQSSLEARWGRVDGYVGGVERGRMSEPFLLFGIG